MHRPLPVWRADGVRHRILNALVLGDGQASAATQPAADGRLPGSAHQGADEAQATSLGLAGAFQARPGQLSNCGARQWRCWPARIGYVRAVRGFAGRRPIPF